MPYTFTLRSCSLDAVRHFFPRDLKAYDDVRRDWTDRNKVHKRSDVEKPQWKGLNSLDAAIARLLLSTGHGLDPNMEPTKAYIIADNQERVVVRFVVCTKQKGTPTVLIGAMRQVNGDVAVDLRTPMELYRKSYIWVGLVLLIPPATPFGLMVLAFVFLVFPLVAKNWHKLSRQVVHPALAEVFERQPAV